MVLVKGFRGIRYNKDKIGDFSKIIAPPYDVIDEKQQDELYERDPMNVVRLILAKGEGEKRYSDASKTFSEWLKQSVLMQDSEPCIYPYYQEFEFEGKKFRRKGLIAAVKISDFEEKAVLPHERTFKKHKEDRLKLTDACRANLSQVFTVYSDKEGNIEKLVDENLGDPVVDVYNDDNVRNTLWKISDKDILNKVTELFRDKTLLIADGHHRYETAINYRNKRREEEGNPAGEKPYDYVMMYISRGEGEGLVINPTHRVVRTPGKLGTELLRKKLEEYFNIEEIPLNSSSELAYNQIAVVLEDSENQWLLEPKEKFEKKYNNMAVMILHNIIFKDIISEQEAGILYTKFREEVFELVKNGDYKLGFLLPKLKSEDIFDVVLDGTKMPHKTTYFYPKTLSGLVFNPLW